MRVLLIGVGTVGEAIARLSADRDWCEAMVLADYDEARARSVADALGGAPRFRAARIDARDASAVTELARAHRADVVMNAVDPQFVMPNFTGALEADANYVDMAMSLSKPHAERPYELPGVKLGDEQFALAAEWESRGRLALVGMGMDPGLTDVFAAHASRSRRPRHPPRGGGHAAGGASAHLSRDGRHGPQWAGSYPRRHTTDR